MLDESWKFVEGRSSYCNWRHLAVQHSMLANVLMGALISNSKKETIIKTSLSVMNQLSVEHPDPTFNPNTILNLQSDMYSIMGLLKLGHVTDRREDEAKEGLKYLETCKDMMARYGGEEFYLADLEAKISHFKSACVARFGAQNEFGESDTKEKLAEKQRIAYEAIVRAHGEVTALNQGANYVEALGLQLIIS